jgi:hypothetical protein
MDNNAGSRFSHTILILSDVPLGYGEIKGCARACEGGRRWLRRSLSPAAGSANRPRWKILRLAPIPSSVRSVEVLMLSNRNCIGGDWVVVQAEVLASIIRTNVLPQASLGRSAVGRLAVPSSPYLALLCPLSFALLPSRSHPKIALYVLYLSRFYGPLPFLFIERRSS